MSCCLQLWCAALWSAGCGGSALLCSAVRLRRLVGDEQPAVCVCGPVHCAGRAVQCAITSTRAHHTQRTHAAATARTHECTVCVRPPAPVDHADSRAGRQAHAEQRSEAARRSRNLTAHQQRTRRTNTSPGDQRNKQCSTHRKREQIDNRLGPSHRCCSWLCAVTTVCRWLQPSASASDAPLRHSTATSDDNGCVHSHISSARIWPCTVCSELGAAECPCERRVPASPLSASASVGVSSSRC